jgi:NAD-reducing hydrogenase small subunit
MPGEKANPKAPANVTAGKKPAKAAGVQKKAASAAAPKTQPLEMVQPAAAAAKPKPKIATVSMAGCFGCHMSLLDIDERILKLVELVEFNKSPIDDIKVFTSRCAIGLLEGGCCTDENVHNLQEFRKHCDILVSVGDCATMGGVPAMRNMITLKECLDEAYQNGPTVYNPKNLMPNDPEIPLILDRVYPCHEVVKIDYLLPGCPPSADTLYAAITALLFGEPLKLPYELIKYD